MGEIASFRYRTEKAVLTLGEGCIEGLIWKGFLKR